MYSGVERFAVSALNCGYADLSLLDGVVNISDAYRQGMNLNELMYAVFRNELNKWKNKARKYFLNIDNDIEIWCNCLDTSVTIIDNQSKYAKYFRKEMKEFYENTGFEIICNV